MSCCAFYSTVFFTTPLTTPTSACSLSSIANGLPIHGIGSACITLCTHKNKVLHLYIPHSPHIPDLPCNLISLQWQIQSFQKQNKNSSFHIFPHGCLFIVNNHMVPLPYHPSSNLPVFQLLPPNGIDFNSDSLMDSPSLLTLLQGFQAITSSPSQQIPFQLQSDDYSNMSTSQWLLYNWHVCLRHMNFAAIQSIACKNLGIPCKLAQCPSPLCWQCQYGKAKRHSIQDPRPIGEQLLQPGEMCCVDQMIAGCLGLSYTMHGHQSL